MNRASTPLFIAFALIAGASSFGLVFLFDQVEHVSVFFLVLAMFLMFMIPIFVRLLRKEFDLFEPTIPYGAMNFLYYGAGALFVLFVQGVAQDGSVLPYLDLAVAYCALGYACVLLGYYVARRVVSPRLDASGPFPGLAVISCIYGIGYVGEITYIIMERTPAGLISIVSGVNSLVSQMAFLATFSLFYVFFMVMAGRATKGMKTFLFAVMIPTQIMGAVFRFGNKTALFLALGIPILAYWYARRKIAWKSLIVIFLVSVFIVFPLYYTVRNYTSPFYSQKYRLTKTFETMTKAKADVFAEGALRTTAKRLAIVNSTAVVIRECGTRVDYEYGNTLWLGVVSAAIPRILWPEKPNINIGIEFGKKFHMTPFGNYSSISPSQVGELYWNFNVPGIVMGMFALGVFLSVLYLRFGANRGAAPFRLAMYITVMFAFLQSSDGYLGALESVTTKEILVLLVLERGLMFLETSRQRSAVAGTESAVPLMVR